MKRGSHERRKKKMRKALLIWMALLLALVCFSSSQARAEKGSRIVVLPPDEGSWNFYTGGWEAPFSSGQFYGLEASGPKRGPKDWEMVLKWLLKLEAYQGVTADNWHFGAIEPFGGVRLCLLVSSLDLFERERERGEIRFDLLIGARISVPEWNDGNDGVEGLTIHPRLQIDLWGVSGEPEINLAYKNNAELKYQRWEGEGKILFFRKGIFQVKGGIGGARDETGSSYRAQEYSLLLEPKLTGRSSSLTLFGKMGYAREELLWKKEVVDGPRWVAGVCWSF
jgi:hypothetical protein